MRITSLFFATSVVVLFVSACAQGEATQTPSPSPVSSVVTGGTQAAPTRNPGSTPLPWWGGTIPLQDPGEQLVDKPADLAIASDGTIYVADIGSHGIVHLDAAGSLLGKWGSFSATDQPAAAPEGTFNEPWGIAAAPDGTVYVADTWNHRIQAFSAAGDFLRTWGQPGQGSEPYGFFGPRDIAVGNDGLVYISDTGNNRIGVYTPEGQFVAQIGGKGNQPGQFDEPVGIAFSADGDLFVADEGNQRVQVLAVGQTGSLQAKGSWSVDAWPHNEMLYKPYLTVVGDRVYITDTESGSILEYTAAGLHLMTYDLNSTGYLNYGLVYGIDAQPDGVLWVSDLAGGAAVLVRIVPAP